MSHLTHESSEEEFIGVTSEKPNEEKIQFKRSAGPRKFRKLAACTPLSRRALEGEESGFEKD